LLKFSTIFIISSFYHNYAESEENYSNSHYNGANCELVLRGLYQLLRVGEVYSERVADHISQEHDQRDGALHYECENTILILFFLVHQQVQRV
jgi:hypothetical protein